MPIFHRTFRNRKCGIDRISTLWLGLMTNTKSAILDQRRLQKLNEVQELKIQYEAVSNGLALIRQEISTLEPLVEAFG